MDIVTNCVDLDYRTRKCLFCMVKGCFQICFRKYREDVSGDFVSSFDERSELCENK